MSIKNAKSEYTHHYIYGLHDPETGLLRYIGITVRPYDRLRNHCNEKVGTHRTNWIQGLKRRGLEPVMFILGKYPIGCEWENVERSWIKYARENEFKLTNATDGGDGVLNPTKEARVKMTAWQVGRKLTEEHKRKVGEASKGRTHDQSWRDDMSKKMKGRKITWNEKLRDAVSKLSPDQVREIRVMLNYGQTQLSIAKIYGVDKGTISNIKRRVSYGHVDQLKGPKGPFLIPSNCELKHIYDPILPPSIGITLVPFVAFRFHS